MFVERLVLDLTVNASGAATVYSAGLVSGRVLQLTYTPDGSSPLDTGADLAITGELSGTVIATLTDIGTAVKTWAPRQAVHTVLGVAALYAAGGVAVLEPVTIAGERIKVVVAQGGTSLKGTLNIFIG